MSTEYGDPGIEWGEADAANDDGEAVMRAEREAGEADADLPEACAWHGGEGDSGPGCPYCRDEQDPSGAPAFRGHGPGCGCPDCEGARRDEDPQEPVPDPVLDARVKALAVRLAHAEAESARSHAQLAQSALRQLAGIDEELGTADENDAREALIHAQASLAIAERVAAARLKPITDAERDAELGRLRARTAELERLRAAGFPEDSGLRPVPCLQPEAHGRAPDSPRVACADPGHDAPAPRARPDILPDLARLLIAAHAGRRDSFGYADRIASALVLGDDDSEATAEAALRKALGPVLDREQLGTALAALEDAADYRREYQDGDCGDCITERDRQQNWDRTVRCGDHESDAVVSTMYDLLHEELQEHQGEAGRG